MCDCDPGSISYWLVSARAIHFAASLLLFGMFAFDRFYAMAIEECEPLADRWRRHAIRLGLLCLLAGVISGIAWFVLVASAMSGVPLADLLHDNTLSLVCNQTHFGRVWRWRAFFFSLTTAFAALLWLLPRRAPGQKPLRWVAFVSSAASAASLAWAGHGQSGLGQSATWHLSADVLHLLVSGVWPMGLIPFGLLLGIVASNDPAANRPLLFLLIHRFSAVSLASVALLTLTGLVNSWFLVGSIPGLLHSSYGHVLLIKCGLLAIMLGFGAANLLYLKPRIGGEKAAALSENPAQDVRRLRLNIAAEITIALLVTLSVAVLGLLAPPAG